MSQLASDKPADYCFYDKKLGVPLTNFVITLKTEVKYGFYYHLVRRLKWDGSMLTIDYGEPQEIRIEGMNLSALFEDLTSQCVLGMREANQAELQRIKSLEDHYKDVTVIEKITVHPE
jgi:hypothetical protein